MLQYLKTNLPADGYCIIGVTWVDLYSSEDWNFVLGESSCEDGCAVMSFGHFEPQSYDKYFNGTLDQSNEMLSSLEGMQCDKGDKSIPSVHREGSDQSDLRLYLEDFADVEKVNKEIIWRLLRVRVKKKKTHTCH